MGDSAGIAGVPSQSRGNVVFCRGLSFKATEADIRGILADCGDILSVSMPLDARSRPSGTAYVEFDSSDACARAIAKATAGISHLGRYIEVMPRLQHNDSRRGAPPPPHGKGSSDGDGAVLPSGLARILAAQPKKSFQTRLPDDSPVDAASADPSGAQSTSADRQRATTPRRVQSSGQAVRLQPWRDPKNAGTPSTHRMPIDVACRICIGAELSGKLSPLEDYDREITWIEHDLAGATERLERHRKELSCLTQDKALLDEQVTEEMKSRQQRSEEHKAQIEALKAAKFNCRRLMLEIMRSMPAAALQGDAHRFCTQSDLKAQIKRLQEVSEQDPESIIDKPDVHAKPDISINGIRKVWGQSRLILETEKRVSDYISRLSAASRVLAEAESALSVDVKGHRSVTPGRVQLSADIRDCVAKRNEARNEVEVLVQMMNLVKKERVRNVRRHDFVVQQHDVAMDFGGLCRSPASCGWHFCTLPSGHDGRCQVCPLETVIYCSCKESTLTVQCGREKERVPCPSCDKYSCAPLQPIASLVSQVSSQPSASDWVMPGSEWGIQDPASSEWGNEHEAGSAVTENRGDEHFDADVSHSSVLHRSESPAVSPNLDESVDAVRNSKKRQVSESKIGAIKKAPMQTVKTAQAAAGSYDGPIYKPKILSHEAMMARVHDLLKAEELSAASKLQDHSGKISSNSKEQRQRAVTPQTKTESAKAARVAPPSRSRSGTPSADHRGKFQAAPASEHQQQDFDKKSSLQTQHSDSNPPPSSSDSADAAQLQEDDIRRRILEAKAKKQKKASGAGHAFSSPYAVAGVFAIIAVVIISLSLIPEDSRFYNADGRRQQRAASSTEDEEYAQDQQDLYEQQQEQLQWQRRESQGRNYAREDDDPDWNTGQDSDDFYQNSGSGSQDADDDDYAPWNEKPSRLAEPAVARTHRVVQQRIVPPDAGERLRV